MATATSRPPKKRRAYPGQKEAAHLITCLNSSVADYSVMRDVVCAIKRAFQIADELAQFSISAQKSKAAMRLIREQHSIQSALSLEFQNYTLRPIVRYVTQDLLTFDWYPWSARGDRSPMLSVIEFARNGLLAKLVQCVQCERWFFRKFSHQRHCSSRCRRKWNKKREREKDAQAFRNARAVIGKRTPKPRFLGASGRKQNAGSNE